MDVGEKLALARDYHSPALTQEALARMLGIHTSSVGRWESKDHIPPDRLTPLAEILDVREEWFFDGSDRPPTEARRTLPEAPNVRGPRPEEVTVGQRMMVEGMTVALPVWRGVVAGDEDECAFVESEEPEFREVAGYLTMGQPSRYILCIASGMSMAPRIEHADRAVVRLDPDVPPNHIVVSRTEDNRNFIKKLARGGTHRLELHSLNEHYRPITDLKGWTIKGGVVAILRTYEPGKPNIEWDEGRFLRA